MERGDLAPKAVEHDCKSRGVDPRGPADMAEQACKWR